MEIRQQLKQSQQLVMTPQLQQAIKLLQMSRAELVDMVREELTENPVLEDQGQSGEVSLQSLEQAERNESNTIDKQQAQDDRTIIDQSAPQDKKTEEIDWDRYLENHSLQAPTSSRQRLNDDDLPGVDATLSRGEGLVGHLLWQVRMSDFLEEERNFAILVAGNLDEQGYLKLEDCPKEEIVPRLAAEAGLDAEDAEEVLRMMQRMDPVGVASRDLRECLLVQAELLKIDELAMKVLSDHLPSLEKKNYTAIAKALEVDVEEIYDVAQFISELEPRPARDYLSEDPRYITPDVHVVKLGEEYVVQANDDGMPRLKITSSLYKKAMGEDAKAKEYIQNKLRSAQWLIRSLDQRRKTIVRVTECIVEKQKEFFDKGIEFMRPMILRDVAETVGMHESTISRVTSNKYVATPRGVFELKYFFNSAIKRDHADDIASESVKQAIKQLIQGEDNKDPLSDQSLVEMLAQQDIMIARRTVAKYREMLGILSSSKRKKYF